VIASATSAPLSAWNNVAVREWHRSTTRCGWDALPSGALASYAERHGIADLADGVVVCVQTLSEPVKRRRFGKGAASKCTVIAATARYLVWASGDSAADAVAAARLSQIETHEYRPTVIDDTGLEVVGFRLGASERESWFLPLDDSRDGQYFRAQLALAIADAGAC
jgi:hypothetical protein